MLSALGMGILFGWYIHHDYVKWNRLGREAFSAYQLNRFDHYMASPRPIALTLFGAVIVVFIFLGVYELIALALSKASWEETTTKQSPQC
jgi:hypothetical protein